MNPALILPLMMRTTRAGMSGISIPPAVSGGLQENQGTRTDLTSVRNLTEADTKKELAKIAAKAKEKQREHGGTAPGRTLCQISDEVIDTKKELAKIAGVSVRFEGATTEENTGRPWGASPYFPHHPLGPVKSAFLDTGSPYPGEEIQGGSSPGTNDPAPAISGGNRGGFKLLQHVPHTSLGLHTFLA